MSTRTEGPGSRLIEELRLLLDAVAERAGPWLDRIAESGHGEHGEHGAFGAHGHGHRPGEPLPDDWCPLCAVLALISGEPSEVVARSLGRAADLVALLRAVLADRWEPGVPHMPGFRPEPRSGPSPGVQRIPVRRKGTPG
ncbi:MAG: hypothetical protein ACJ72N_04935 [Labedaea sp.]